MSIVTDRRCDGCGEIVERADGDWWALTPPGWDGEDCRMDFCDLKCLKKWARDRPDRPRRRDVSGMALRFLCRLGLHRWIAERPGWKVCIKCGKARCV